GNADSNAGWGPVRLVTNSLGDLAKRENRYGHWPRYASDAKEGYPHDARIWGKPSGQLWGTLGLPTLRESSAPNWPFPLFGNAPSNPASSFSPPKQHDFWVTPNYPGLDSDTGALPGYTGNRNPERITEDVILKNVLSFDIKVWDPLAPALRGTNNQVLEP